MFAMKMKYCTLVCAEHKRSFKIKQKRENHKGKNIQSHLSVIDGTSRQISGNR